MSGYPGSAPYVPSQYSNQQQPFQDDSSIPVVTAYSSPPRQQHHPPYADNESSTPVVSPPPLSNTSDWFDHYDHDRSGTLDKEEVVSALVQISGSGQQEGIRQTFSAIWPVFDHDGSGAIDKQEFCAPRGLGESLVAMMQQQAPSSQPYQPQAPSSQPHQYSQHEPSMAPSSNMWGSSTGGIQDTNQQISDEKHSQPPPSKPTDLSSSDEKLWKNFEKIDKDNSGYIDRQDLRELVKKSGLGQVVSDKMLDKAIAKVDKNKDGKISFDEYKKVDKYVDMAKKMAKMALGKKKK